MGGGLLDEFVLDRWLAYLSGTVQPRVDVDGIQM
jgi:hypothetical protein